MHHWCLWKMSAPLACVSANKSCDAYLPDQWVCPVLFCQHCPLLMSLCWLGNVIPATGNGSGVITGSGRFYSLTCLIVWNGDNLFVFATLPVFPSPAWLASSPVLVVFSDFSPNFPGFSNHHPPADELRIFDWHYPLCVCVFVFVTKC